MPTLLDVASAIRDQFDENELKAAVQKLNLDYDNIVPSKMNYEEGSNELLRRFKRRGWLKKLYEELKNERLDAKQFQQLMKAALEAVETERTTIGAIFGEERVGAIYGAADATKAFLLRHRGFMFGTGTGIVALISIVSFFSDEDLRVKMLDEQSFPTNSVDLKYFLKQQPREPVSALATRDPDEDFLRIPVSKLADGIPIVLELNTSGPAERTAASFQVQQMRYETSQWKLWGNFNKLFLIVRVRSTVGGN